MQADDSNPSFAWNFSGKLFQELMPDKRKLIFPPHWSVFHRATISLLLEHRKHFEFSSEPSAAILKEREFLQSLPVPLYPLEYDVREVQANDVEAEWITHRQYTNIENPTSFPVVLFFHGGTFVSLHPKHFRETLCEIAKKTDPSLRILTPNYRHTPEHAFPCALKDCIASYKYLLSEGYPPDQIIFIGDSSGGNLALATMFEARDRGLPFPSSLILMSPWVDLDYDSQKQRPRRSLQENSEIDIVDIVFDELCARAYLSGHNPRDPLVSPLFGDFSGFPPTLIQSGELEVSRDEINELADNMKQEGVKTRYHCYEGEVHDFVNFPTSPSREMAIDEISSFIKFHTGGVHGALV